MPRKSELHSLLQLSLLNVVENIDSVWCKHYVNVFKEHGPYRYVLGPFNDIPSFLVNEILQVLKREKKLKRHHLDLLITPQLSLLDLSKEQEDVGYPLDLVGARCQKIKALRLSYCQKIPNRVYQDILPLLTELQSLDLNGTNCRDSTLFIVGAYLLKLRELDVTGCTITDQGITGLCGGVDDLNKPSDRLGQCRQLVKLCINYTKVSDQGIQTALENLPQLRILECHNSIGVLAFLHRDAWEHKVSKLPQYLLRNLACLELTSGKYETGSLQVAVDICPNVSKVDLVTHSGLTNQDLLSLMKLTEMRELLIMGGASTSISFYESIAPLLQIQGHSLQSLTLAELSDVNVQVIAQHCQNLEKLELVMNRSFSRYWPDAIKAATRRKCLPKLRKLTVVCSTHLDTLSDIPGDHLKPLLSSPRLQHLFLKECQSLNDDLLQEVLLDNTFSELQHLELEQCHQITDESIESFLKVCPLLSTLKMWECRELTRQNAANWSKLAKRKKWLLTVDWA